LNTAYAHGLLSEDTYIGRLDELLRADVVDQNRIAGDLNLRRSEPSALQRTGEAITVPFARLGEWLRGGEPGPPTLLALDWSGATTELTLGRHTRNDIVLLDPAVSRSHAELRYRDGRWIIRDLESKNGSFVNGVRVGRSELRPGDVLMVGDGRLLVD
jgi:hypothetical protein